MKLKELIEIYEEFKEDDLEISLEFTGHYDMELNRGDCFKVNDYNVTNKALYKEIYFMIYLKKWKKKIKVKISLKK